MNGIETANVVKECFKINKYCFNISNRPRISQEQPIKTNKCPNTENGWLEDQFRFGKACFQVLYYFQGGYLSGFLKFNCFNQFNSWIQHRYISQTSSQGLYDHAKLNHWALLNQTMTPSHPYYTHITPNPECLEKHGSMVWVPLMGRASYLLGGSWRILETKDHPAASLIWHAMHTSLDWKYYTDYTYALPFYDLICICFWGFGAFFYMSWFV